MEQPTRHPHAIDDFSGEHEFLSNFAHSPITDRHGNTYPTVEHAFQAMKSLDPGVRENVRIQPTPAKAKYVGRSLAMRPDWEAIKDAVMLRLVRAKFAQNPDLAARLAATGDSPLIEGNTWGDRYWGVAGGVGRNRLGETLMRVRAELRQQPESAPQGGPAQQAPGAGP